jgi:hypothetical protein
MEPFSEQIGPIRVGLSGLFLVVVGAAFWFLVDPIDVPATLIHYVGAASMIIGTASVAIWVTVAVWRREKATR